MSASQLSIYDGDGGKMFIRSILTGIVSLALLTAAAAQAPGGQTFAPPTATAPVRVPDLKRLTGTAGANDLLILTHQTQISPAPEYVTRSMTIQQLSATILGTGTTGVALPTISTTAALQTTPSTLASEILRLGYVTSGDAPPQPYLASTAACTLNAGAGDGGTQIPSSDGKCWIAVWPSSGIDIRQYGVNSVGGADAQPKIQAAVNQVCAASAGGIGASLYLPRGSYLLNSTINISCAIRLYGDTKDTTVLLPINSIAAITANTQSQVILERFAVNYSVAPTNANLFAIIVETTTTGLTFNTASIIRDVQVYNSYNAIQMSNAVFFEIADVFIEVFPGIGVQVSCLNHPDGGDSKIHDSTFFGSSGSPTSGSGILWLSSGGLRVSNNKFGNLANGVDFAADITHAGGAVTTGQLYVEGNSCDTMTQACLIMSRLDATAFFNEVTFTGNICANNGTCVEIPNDANGNWLSNVSISGNSWFSPAAVAGTGFLIAGTAVQNVTVVGNVCNSTVAGSTCVSTTANNSNVTSNAAIGTYGTKYSIGGTGSSSTGGNI